MASISDYTKVGENTTPSIDWPVPQQEPTTYEVMQQNIFYIALLPIFVLLCTILYKNLYLKKSFTKGQIIRRAI